MLIKSDSNVNFEPFKALIFYKSEDRFDIQNYLEVSDIVNGRMKQKRPLSEDEMDSILSPIKALNEKKFEYYFEFNDRQIINYKVLSKRLCLSWIVNAHEDNFILGRKKNIETINYPNLIFSIKGNSLSVLCFKGKFNGLKTKVYKAPFPNIYEDNTMCFGNINVSSLFSKNLNITMKNFEDSFFNTGFNALESQNRSKSNTFELLKSLVKTKQKFPDKELILIKEKIKNVIS